MLPSQNANVDVQVIMANKYRINPSSVRHSHSSRTQDEQFFQYVRQGKYKQAYVLGEQIMQKRPNHKSIANFCQYILKNMMNEPEEHSEELQSSSSSSGSGESETEQNTKNSKQQNQQSETNTDPAEQEIQSSSQQQQNSSDQSIYSPPHSRKDTPKKVINFSNTKTNKRASQSIKSRYRPSPEIPKLTLNQNTSVVKESLKNFINIRLNSEKQNTKQKRYTLQNNQKSSSFKLPTIVTQINQKNANSKFKQQSASYDKQNAGGQRKSQEDLNVKSAGLMNFGQTQNQVQSKRVSLNSNIKIVVKQRKP